jgi:hypothetical protein
MKFRDLVEQRKQLGDVKEEMAVNAMAHGKIAGSVEAGDDPLIRKRKQAIMTLRKGLHVPTSNK